MKKLTPAKKILVMRYRFIGDTLLTVPFLRNLRRAYPDAQIDFLAASNSGELLARCPYINNLIYLDKEAPSFLQAVSMLKKNHYDTAFVLKRSLSSAAMAFLSGIPQRIGFDTEGRGLLLTHRIPYGKPGMHERDCFLDVLKQVGIPVEDDHLEYWPEPAAESKAADWFIPYASRRNILFHATSSNPAKQWRDEHWQALTQKLLAEDPDLMLHAVGAKNDASHYEAIAQAAGGRFKNWCGQTTLDESMSLIARMQTVIGVDSGTLHMAAAVGVPVLALFGPMDETRWLPVGGTAVTHALPCRPCNLKTPCHHGFACMADLSAGRVLDALHREAAVCPQ